MALAKVHIVIMRLALNWDACFKVIVRQNYLIFVNSRFLWNEFKNELFRFSDLQNSFVLAKFEALWDLNLPLGGFLADVSNHDWFLGVVLDWNLSEIQNIWEVDHSSASNCSNWNDELFSLGEYIEIVRVIRLGLWRKFNDERNFHSWSNSL